MAVLRASMNAVLGAHASPTTSKRSTPQTFRPRMHASGPEGCGSRHETRRALLATTVLGGASFLTSVAPTYAAEPADIVKNLAGNVAGLFKKDAPPPPPPPPPPTKAEKVAGGFKNGVGDLKGAVEKTVEAKDKAVKAAETAAKPKAPKKEIKVVKGAEAAKARVEEKAATAAAEKAAAEMAKKKAKKVGPVVVKGKDAAKARKEATEAAEAAKKVNKLLS